MKILDETELHPWGIILGFLFDLSSDEICKIIDLTGLQVDWELTEAESYSDRTRKRAYRSKIHAAYKLLSNNEKLRIAWIVAGELTKNDEEFTNKLNTKLSKIGWKLESGKLTTDNLDVIELFFPKGTQHDAYVKIRSIIQDSTKTLIIIDPYLNDSIFCLLGTLCPKKIQLKLLTHNVSSDFSVEVQKFLRQHSCFSLEVRKTKEFHDRFIIIDAEQCYHIGASIKDAGNKAFMISQIEDQTNKNALIKQLLQSWDSAEIISI